MKQNLLKILLLASTVSTLLVGCNDTPSSTSDSVDTNASASSNAPIEIDEDLIYDAEKDQKEVVIELDKHIYLENERIDDEIHSRVTKFDVWSKSVEQFRSKLSNFEATLVDKNKYGENYVKIEAGATNVRYVKIYYYKTVEDAIAATTIHMPTTDEEKQKLFNLERYIETDKNTGKISLRKTESFVEDGTVYVADANRQRIRGNTAPNTYLTKTNWSKKDIEYWFDPDKMEVGHYDSTKKTLAHYVANETDYYCISPLPDNTFETDPITATFAYEIIADKDGKICYAAKVDYNVSDPITPTSNRYWSYYKDYKTNPAFSFSDTYDPTDTTGKQLEFQKVLPEGGLWLFGVNNRHDAADAQIDQIWNQVSGQNGKQLYNDAQNIKNTMDNAAIESTLMSARIKDSENKGVRVYLPANAGQLYAYYYAEAANNYPDLVAEGEKVLDGIYRANLPEVTIEEVLYNYYNEKSKEEIAEWVAKFPTTSE